MGEPYVAVVALQPHDASTTLFFQHLRERLACPLRIVGHASPDLPAALAGANAIVVVRALFECPAVVRFARTFGVPLIYFLDDNFMLLREAGGPAAKFVTRYSLAAVREALRPFSAVLLATPPLAHYFRQHQLTDDTHLFGPTLGGHLGQGTSDEALTIAFFGGAHLHESIHQHVLPAVRQLAQRRAVKLIVVGVANTIESSPGLSIVALPYYDSYSGGVARLAAEHVDVLLHPVAAGINSLYKNPHALITASMLDAIPIVSRRAPYDSLGADVALLAEDSAESWLRQLAIADDAVRRASMRSSLRAFCESAFDGRVNAILLADLSSRSAPPSWPSRWWRTAVARIMIGHESVRRLVARLAPPTANKVMS